MQHSRVVLPLALILILAACAPSAEPEPPAQAAAPAAPAPEPTPEPAPAAPAPEVTTSGANAAFDLVASRNGQTVQTRFEDGFHYVETPAYTLGLSFSPNEILSVDNAEYDAYADTTEGLESVNLLLRLLESGPTGFEFSIANKSQNPIQIVWDETAIVTTDGSSSRVIHEGVRFSEMNNAQPPTIIPPGARVDEYAGPTNLIRLNDEWQTDPLFRDFEQGTTVSFFLALNVNNERQNLNFSFAANRQHEVLRGGDLFSK